MNHEQFIEKNIQAELKKLGFSLSVIQRASYMAVEHYRRIAQASKKGRIFDDCLHIAKVWASKFTKDKI
ncbi:MULTISPECIES: hypothetical protein [Enterobacterales]|uniref:hypothetical protein n=1 Tax=Enterobacterales TaxID=91347 RepID=UPI000B7AF55C|nr:MULTISPECIES: hypothetical protein [Enterobacterales]OXK82134.1 hypothetical protein CD821_23940 [Escherichia coli]